MKYGEKIIKEFDLEKDFEIWENKGKNDYAIYLTLPEFMSFCPRSGYPDFGTIFITYVPDKVVVELKTIKLYINTFMHKNTSHEGAINEIYETLDEKLKPKYLQVVGDFNPRGNVHTVIELNSNLARKEHFDTSFIKEPTLRKFP